MSSSSPTHRGHALIIGAGIAGPAMALFLKKAGFTATVFEASGGGRSGGGALQLASNGMHVMRELGLAEQVVAAGSITTDMAFLDGRGRVLARIKTSDPREPDLTAVTLPRATVTRILVAEARRQGIAIAYDKKLAEIGDAAGSKLVARFEDGTRAEGDFLIGADGIHSRTREILIPGGPKPFFIGLLGIGGFVSRSAMRAAGVTDEHTMSMIFGPGSFFGYGYAGADETEGAGWWVNPPRAVELSREELAAMTTEQLRRDLLARHRGWPAPVEALIAATPEIIVDNIRDVAGLPYWHRGRIVLIGDAAHAVSPNSGQGASLAIEDALMLGRLLRDHQGPVEAAFGRFEAERRPRIEKIIAWGRRSADNKKIEGRVGLWVRDRMIALFLPYLMKKQAWIQDYRARWDDRTDDRISA